MRYLSFFSGAMGLDHGLNMAGWSCLGANELDPVAQKTILANEPELPLLGCDIRELDAESVLRQFEIRKEGIDAVVGGPPCQAFSTAGRRSGLSDERGHVFLHFVKMALDLDPKLIVIENVRGLLSVPLVHRPHKERGEGYPELAEEEKSGGALRKILELFDEKEYGVSFRLYDTSLFGVPQKRERVVLVASKNNRIAPHLVPRVSQKTTLMEAIGSYRGVHEFIPLRPNQPKFLKHLKPGENWRSLPEKLQKEALGNAYYSSGGRTGFCRRLAWDSPAPTLVTNPTMPATLLAHPEEMRPLSVEEYLMIQTFPLDYQVIGTTQQKYQQIGNAVPVHFGYRIGLHLNAWVEGRRFVHVPTATSRYAATDETAWFSVHS